MTIRIKSMGVAAAIAAIALSIPTAVSAFAEPTPGPTPPPIPAPTSNIPGPQGPDCNAFKDAAATGDGFYRSMITLPASAAIASNPELSTFSQAISGQLNPAVNLVGVLDNGPYNVFAPTNEAFAKLDPAQFEALKANPEELTSVLYYHMALGFLGPDTIEGKLTSQQGTQLTVTGSGGDIKVDDVAKVECGGITAASAKIYMIDTVLNPADALPANVTTTTTSPTETTIPETTATSAPEVTAPAEAPAEAPVAEAPVAEAVPAETPAG